MRFRAGDGLWVRLVDVGEALSARTYGDGSVAFDVSTSSAPGTRRAAADLRCDVSALGSVYLGAFGFSELVRAGRVEELRPGAAARTDVMVTAARAPWCPEIF